MKKIMIALVISFVLCVVLGVIASNGLNYGVLEKTYNYNSSDTLLDENSKLSLLSYDYNGVNYGVLGFNNKNLTINDNGSVSSYIVGKNCLSIMANIFDINTNVNKSIMTDLVGKLREKLNGENSEIIINNEKALNPYIISKNDEYIFIDYVTGCLNDRTKVVYYRIIIQDVNKLGLELSEEELKSLNDYLPTLLNILSIPVEEVK